MTSPERPSVLFVCVHNAGRSQMAAAYLTHVTLLTAARGLCYGAPANFKLNQSRKA